jgi:hypothetical protein
MKTKLVALLVAGQILLIGPFASAQCRVWTVTETRHVLRSDPPQETVAVNIAAARNEWVAFQILIRSDKPVNGVDVQLAPLNGPSGHVIAASNMRLYRQHQLHIEIGTYRNEGFKADWYPDPLIPAEPLLPPKATYPARFKAVPFDLPANETHGFWVDCYVPAETPPDKYTAVYRVISADGPAVEIPVALTVWNFTLPPTPTLVTAFGSPADRIPGWYREKGIEAADWSYVEDQCALMLSQHRFNATPPSEMLRPQAQPDGSYEIPAAQLHALREFVDRYHVNALQTPHPSSAVKDPDAQSNLLKAWLAAFDKAAAQIDRPHVVFFTYLRDEPNTEEDYRYVQKWGRAVRQANSIVEVMVVEQTWTEPGQGGADSAWGDLYGAIDIWCPLFSLQRPDSAAQRRQLGETIWTYTALCQGEPTPWWHIDYPLLNYRVPAWMAWHDEMKGLLYWGGMSYWRQAEDPWLTAPIYTGSGKPQQGPKAVLFNGEGSLVYPARALGYDGIAPTIRLKALRDAIEDYEYLAILDRAGKKTEAQGIVHGLTESWFQWNKDPAAYETARAQLAAMITATSQSPAPPADVSEQADPRPRLVILTDIGGDPDDQQSMIRLMTCSNEFAIEGLLATASGVPGELKVAITRPDLIRQIVLAYGQVRDNLMRHANGWPETHALLDCIKSGNPNRGRNNVGDGHDTDASRRLIERIDAGTPQRPLNIAIWGGQTDLAQALWRVRNDRGPAGLAAFTERFRVYDIGDQDAIAEWMHAEFPGMYYILSQPPAGGDRRLATYRGMYLGGDESLTSREWIDRNVTSKGPLGALYPLKTWTAPNPHACLKEGDTPSWFFFLPMGGNDPKDPSKPGWGGRYQKAPDSWYRDIPFDQGDPREIVSSRRPQFQADFAKRMAWCLPD